MSAVADPLAYPFGIPSGSFLAVAGEARGLDGVSLAGRVRVLAFGANASPAALGAKLGPRARVPVVAARLHDFDVVYSAHVSPYGAIPGTLQHAPGAVAEVHVVHLEAHELGRVHRSEPNYRYVRLDGIDVRVHDGTPLDRIHAYVSRHGCLRLEGAHVGVAAISVRGRLWPALDQAAVLAAARDRLAPDEDLRAFVAAHVADPRLAARRTAALRRDAAPLRWERWEDAGR